MSLAPQTPSQLTLPDVSGIRQRQAAARRLPELPDGRRDPIAPRRRRPKPAARTLHVETFRNTSWLHGERIVALLDGAQITQRQWDHRRRLWTIPARRAVDLMTYAEWHERRVVTEEDRKR